MTKFVRRSAIFVIFFATAAAAQGATGTIKGRVRLIGESPGNPVIRMGMDPRCAEMNAGKLVIQEAIAADPHGDLANVFVRLEGRFPQTPIPSEPVVIDQRKCMYTPRVVGVQVGQTLEVKNTDTLAHDVHGESRVGNSFDTTTTPGGAPFQFKPRREEVMLPIKCDLHRWMTAYAGVVTNPYFAVSQENGAFEITKVPPGTYTIEAWQEVYGVVKKTVRVTSGGTAIVDFTYNSKQTPAGVRRY